MIQAEDIIQLQEKYKDDGALRDALQLAFNSCSEHQELDDLKKELGQISENLERLEETKVINPLREMLKRHGIYHGGM